MKRLHNETRTSPSIPRRLWAEGKPHLLPLYYLLRTSDLGREGIDHSGSYRFADHIYRNEPSGRFGIGPWVDGLLLRLPPAQSMRSRFLYSRSEVVRQLLSRREQLSRAVLSVPCGIGRDLLDAADRLRRSHPKVYAGTTFYGLDIDPVPLQMTRNLAAERGVDRVRLLNADAFDPSAYPADMDVIVSLGLGDFLKDWQLEHFYLLCRDSLGEAGCLITSGMQRDRAGDFLASELAELQAVYRGPSELVAMLKRVGFSKVRASQDRWRLQTLLVAEK